MFVFSFTHKGLVVMVVMVAVMGLAMVLVMVLAMVEWAIDHLEGCTEVLVAMEWAMGECMEGERSHTLSDKQR